MPAFSRFLINASCADAAPRKLPSRPHLWQSEWPIITICFALNQAAIPVDILAGSRRWRCSGHRGVSNSREQPASWADALLSAAVDSQRQRFHIESRRRQWSRRWRNHLAGIGTSRSALSCQLRGRSGRLGSDSRIRNLIVGFGQLS